MPRSFSTLGVALFAFPGDLSPGFRESRVVLGQNQAVGAPGETLSITDGDDGAWYCLGLKYVVYRDVDGVPVVSREEVVRNLSVINKVFGQCRMSFQVDQYIDVEPSDFKLRYRTAHHSELDDIRRTFSDDRTFLVVTTGSWDRTGSIGKTGANAWTSLPGSEPYGVVLERKVGTFANIIAHELGHYLNLLHVRDQAELMSPIIHSTSTRLTQSQCSRAREAAESWWKKMHR